MQAQGLSASGKDIPLSVDENGRLIISSATFSLVQSEDLGAGTKYILKSNGNAWQMIRKEYTDTSSLMSYASATNNAAITLDTAWDNRTTLTYGTATESGI